MADNENNMGTTGASPATPEKTFTQTELDKIVSERLARERGKYADYDALKEKAAAYDAAEEAQKTELQKALERAEKAEATAAAYQAADERNKAVKAAAAASGVDADLLAMMRGDTAEEIAANAAALKARFATVARYPNIHDGGSNAAAPALTKAEIMGIKDERERFKAIKENIHLWEERD